jgi:hypothetical protein
MIVYTVHHAHHFTPKTLQNDTRKMAELKGGCTCGRLRYKLTLDSVDEARTTLCHCSSCKVAMGGAFGLTAKTPLKMYELTKGTPKIFIQDNGVRREFCDNCGSFINEYGEANVDKFRYVFSSSYALTKLQSIISLRRPTVWKQHADYQQIYHDRHTG